MGWRGVTAGILLVLLATSAFAQSASRASTPFELGRAALAAHDPAKAIAHFEQVDTKEGHEWLAVALMMESRTPSDQFVERAFAAAWRARADQAEQARPRADLAARLPRGDMVIALLVSQTHAYAWAFDREAFVGFPLPPPADLATAADGARAYLDRNDRDGLQRIGEQLLPSLLGPVQERLPKLSRLVFVMDGPLLQLPIAELGRADFPRALSVETVDYRTLPGALSHARAAPDTGVGIPRARTVVIGSIAGILLIAGITLAIRR